mmetsp:Transcript_96436/g.241810  ORF Transcript_96436/g.241810 Transcript_96436/m.241810 type:complete len:229 (+) Transcript_96436:2-688(+)
MLRTGPQPLPPAAPVVGGAPGAAAELSPPAQLSAGEGEVCEGGGGGVARSLAELQAQLHELSEAQQDRVVGLLGGHVSETDHALEVDLRALPSPTRRALPRWVAHELRRGEGVNGATKRKADDEATEVASSEKVQRTSDVCPICGELGRGNGSTRNGSQRFRCKEGHSWGEDALANNAAKRKAEEEAQAEKASRPPEVCPTCSVRGYRSGFTPNGKQRFRCRSGHNWS